ncbi:MAG: hypothetical protein ABFD08_14160 [Syntrophomonas sp.]
MKIPSIEKKDMFYWILILGLIVVYLIQHNYGSNAPLVEHIGFAGTLISIILAVLAIIYSYFQNFTTTSSTEKLIDSANRIENVTNTIQSATSELASTSEQITQLEGLLKQVEQDVGKKVDDTMEHHMGQLFQVIQSTEGSFPKEFDPIPNVVRILKVGFSNISKVCQLLYNSYLQHQSLKIMDNDIWDDEVTLLFAIILDSFGLVSLEVKDNDLFVKHFDDRLVDLINEYN